MEKSTDSTIIKATNLTKTFGEFKALSNFSLSLEKGSFFGLLGPNGAGKTTFVRSILDLTDLDKGHITINGIPHHKPEARNHISYLPEKFSFYPNATVREALQFFSVFKISNKKERTPGIEKAMEELSIRDLARKKIKQLSKGQLQRVGLSQLILGNPKVLILDEPFGGLDPLLIKDLKDLLKKLNSEGTTIIINSHILSEVERLCDCLAIIDKGKLLALKKIQEIDQDLEDFFIQTINSNKEAHL